jgi:hypothetical protein
LYQRQFRGDIPELPALLFGIHINPNKNDDDDDGDGDGGSGGFYISW